jgi:putative heme-binding domain-containing protein
MPKSTVRWGIAVTALLAVSGGQLRAQFPAGGPYSQADIQVGARVFTAQCVVCHGDTGNLIAGVDLRSGKFSRASNDRELTELIRNGIKDTAMPAFSFTPAELTGIVAYLRNMRDFNASSVALGSPTRGQTIFEGMGRCATCHRVNGKGPRLAPDLSRVGALRTADALQRVLVDPSNAIQFENRSVRAVTRDGRAVTGRRLNEDTYTVQLIDEQERLVSLTKADLREYDVIEEPLMPSYKDVLSPEEVSDVVAYLLTLKGLR